MSAQFHPVGHTFGGGGAPAEIENVSNVTAEPAPWLCDVIARPASSGWPNVNSCVEPPIGVQFVPSGDVYAVKYVDVPLV